MKNIRLDPRTANFIRSLSDFDLIMLLSEINESGWERTRVELLPLMKKALKDK